MTEELERLRRLVRLVAERDPARYVLGDACYFCGAMRPFANEVVGNETRRKKIVHQDWCTWLACEKEQP